MDPEALVSAFTDSASFADFASRSGTIRACEMNRSCRYSSTAGAPMDTNAIARLTDQPALDKVAQPLSKAVRNAYEAGGTVGQQAKDAMHGVWLGHPLHP